MTRPSEVDRQHLRRALAEARTSFDRGSIPVGAVLAAGPTVLAAGRNRSQEIEDPTAHGEIDCLRQAGLAVDYAGTTLYTTLSPCAMCAGAILFLGIPRVVIGERDTYPGEIELLRERGVAVVIADDSGCRELMRRFIAERPDLWQRVLAGDSLAKRHERTGKR